MFGDSSLLAVIPARGGSKGLPQKNIRTCAGRPLIAWTIAAARGVPSIDQVLVTTDDPAIADSAEREGARVPFLRPPQLATDSASLLDVVRHSWENVLDPRGRRFDCVIVLQPTSPLRGAEHLGSAIERYFAERTSESDTLASVFRVPDKYGWIMQARPDDERYIGFCLDVSSTNPQRQRLRPYYLPNGAIFIARGSALERGFYTERTLAFEMSPADSIDIDTLAEFDMAEKALINRAT